MLYKANTIYKFHPDLDENGERFVLSHTNNFGSCFFNTITKENEEIDEFFMLSSVEINENVLIEA